MTKLSLILAISSFAASGAELSDPGTCKERIKSCEAALESADDAINALHDYTMKQQSLIDDLEFQLQGKALIENSLKAEIGAWYRNPWIMLPLGVAVGAIAVTAIRK